MKIASVIQQFLAPSITELDFSESSGKKIFFILFFSCTRTGDLQASGGEDIFTFGGKPDPVG